MNRTIELLRLVRECGRIEGRKKLQKMIHLLKEAGFPLDYRYGFHFHGPFSAELKGDLDLLTREMIILEEESATYSGEFRQYTYSSSAALNDLLGSVGADAAPEWAGLASALNAKTAQELEAISTIVYLLRSGTHATDLAEQFRRLKPHLESLYESALDFAHGKILNAHAV